MTQGQINDEVKRIEREIKTIYNKVKITVVDIENANYLITKYKRLTNWEERKAKILVGFKH